MLSYHGDPAVKEKYLNRVRIHREADLLCKGEIGSPSRGEKGCAVACTLDAYDHKRYETELGIPEWMARLEDTIFEGLAEKDSQEWPERFLAAVPVGVDLEPVRWRITIRRMDRLLERMKSLPAADYMPAVIASIETVRRFSEAESGGDRCDWAAAAESAAAAAAAAESAAWSAAWSAAAAAAESAVWSAAAAGSESAVWSAEYKLEADSLVEELERMKT